MLKGVVCLDDGMLSACRRNRLMFMGECSVLSGGFRRVFEPACLHMVSSGMQGGGQAATHASIVTCPNLF